VSTDPFCRRVHDYVSAVIDGATEVAASAKGIVDLITSISIAFRRCFSGRHSAYNYWHTCIMRHLTDGFKVWDIVSWISNALQIHRLRLIVD